MSVYVIHGAVVFKKTNCFITFERKLSAFDENYFHGTFLGIIGSEFYNHSGSVVNYLCLPHNPKYGTYNNARQVSGYVYGAEYQVNAFNPFRKNLHDYDAPCAVCFTKLRGQC